MTPLSTPNLDGLLSRLRGRLVGHVRRYAIGRVLLVGSAGVGLLFLADLALDLPGPIRVLHLFLLLGAVGWALWRHAKRPLRAIPERVGLAALLERAHPELFELFTSAAQLSRAEPESEAQRGLISSLIARAEAHATEFELSAVEDPRAPRRALLGGFGALFLVSSVFLSNPDHTSIFFSRMTGSGPEWPRATNLTVEIPLTAGAVEVSPDGELISVSCARGSDIPVVVRAEGEVPDEVILEHAGGARTVLSVTRGGVFRTLLRSVQEDMEFGVTGGDDQDGAPLVAVTVLRPPDIVGLAVEVTPPAYTGAAASIVTDADVEVLAGSSLRVSVQTDPPDAQGLVRVLPSDTELNLEPGVWPVTNAAEGAEPLSCREFSLQPTESLTFRFELTDERGLVNPDPGLFAVRVVPDRAPDIELLSPARGEVETVPGGAISLRARIADDHGVGEVATELLTAPDAEPIASATEVTPIDPWSPQHKDARFVYSLIELEDAQAEVPVEGALTVVAGQTLQLTVITRDRREPESQDGESTSTPILVRVVSADEFLRRLQDRLARVRQSIAKLLDLEIERVMQTSELIRALEGEEPGNTGSGDALSLANSMRRIYGDARSISRDLAEVSDNVIHARLDERNTGLFSALIAATTNRTDRSFDPELWRGLAARDDARSGLTGRLVGVTGLAVEISEDLVEPARLAIMRGSQSDDIEALHEALTESLALQEQARAKTEVLLAELAEWDNFQSVLSLTRDILNRQKSLTERARNYAKEN
ncbi:MAG: DUF4175 domain-containing protein [Planctomycetes bacterium]|nr:DUF4175 domain-containing protein [Planctomycetota bacterium]